MRIDIHLRMIMPIGHRLKHFVCVFDGLSLSEGKPIRATYDRDESTA